MKPEIKDTTTTIARAIGQPDTQALPEQHGQWQGPKWLVATDTTNLWRTSKGQVINEWMHQESLMTHRLWVRFFRLPGEPVVLFFPLEGSPEEGMKSDNEWWQSLVAGARRDSHLHFYVQFRFER